MEPVSLILGIFFLVASLLALGWYVGESVPLTGLSSELGEVKRWVNKHSWLKLMFAGFALYLLLYIPQIMWKHEVQTCDIVKLQETIVAENVTNYTYTSFCYDTGNTTGRSVFLLYTKMLWLVGIYGLVVMLILLIQQILNWRRLL